VLGLAVGVTAFATPAGATPQTDLASKTAQARRLASQIESNSNRADVLGRTDLFLPATERARRYGPRSGRRLD